jgi:hypothetical protein
MLAPLAVQLSYQVPEHVLIEQTLAVMSFKRTITQI